MKKFLFISVVIILAFSCTGTDKKQSISESENDPFPVKYENELFSFSLPEGWVYNDSGWEGLDAIQNTVDFYNPSDKSLWFHFVKSFFNVKWKDIKEATEYSKEAKALGDDNYSLIQEYDSLTISGYPSSLLIYANFVGNDTIIQKQYVTYIQESHILIYFNEVFHRKYWDKAQQLGDALMENIVIKNVDNPLEKINNEERIELIRNYKEK